MTPVVGYMGGKRRIAKRIVSLMPERFELYIESFVGMGAVYLQLRESGYGGPAILADAHPCVSAFWRMIHDKSKARKLIDACKSLRATIEADDFYSAAESVPTDEFELIARFLWLTNYSFGNRPPGFRGGRWYVQGCKLTSAAKHGKTFPWDDVVNRVCLLAARADVWPVEILDSAVDAIERSTEDSVIYADPPYYGTSEYQNECRHVMSALEAARGFVMLSEMSDFPCSWPAEDVKLVARLSNATGANGKREERIFVKPQSML